MYNFIRHITLNEGNTPKTLTQAVLPYKKDDLEPAISEDTINYHYGKLYKTYVERFNNGEGDADFNEAGAFLHHLLFTQYQAPQSSNAPTNIAENFINKYFKSFDNLACISFWIDFPLDCICQPTKLVPIYSIKTWYLNIC